MGILFLVFVVIGLVALLSNIAEAIGQVICGLFRYIILPFGLFLCICYIIKNGL